MQRLATWGQLHDESEPAFQAFVRYRDLGAQRSLKKAAREEGKSIGLFERWSSRHGWGARVASWDLEQQDLHRDARIKAIGDAEERHGKLARAVLGRVAAELGAHQKGQCQTCGRSPHRLTAQQVASWLRVGVDVERTGLGLGSSSAAPATSVNVTTNVQAGGTTNLVLLRDPRAQELASELLGRMRTLDPATSLRKLAGGNGGGRAGATSSGVTVVEPRPTGHAARIADRAQAVADREELHAGEAAAVDPGRRVDELGGFDDDDGDLF